ncbi:MAG: hypothetical protein M0Z50_15665 [Planctomycetia bacterium]|nr:hypothetical protein [Planctomycetia bacterium]
MKTQGNDNVNRHPMSIDLTDAGLAALKALSAQHGGAQKRIMSRLVEWFLEQSQDFQSAVLSAGIPEDVREALLRRWYESRGTSMGSKDRKMENVTLAATAAKKAVHQLSSRPSRRHPPGGAA